MRGTTMFLILFLHFAFTINSVGQKQVVFTEKLNRGIYRNFNEFKANAPSIKDSFDFFITNETRIENGGAENKIKLIDSLGKKRSFKDHVWGCCDGKIFYIHTKGFRACLKI
jgi:hypothetical protein